MRMPCEVKGCGVVCDGSICSVEGVPEKTLLLALLQMRAPCVCDWNSPGGHLCPAIWRGKSVLSEVLVH